jgi:hypothetical protein
VIPMFTAQASLQASGRQHAERPRASGTTGAVPQERYDASGRTALGETGNDLAPVTTCTCPCCQVVNGRLVCC